MSTVTPQTLPYVSGTWGGTYEYRHSASLSTSTLEVYSLYWNTTTLMTNHEIAVNKSTNIWEDHGTDNPGVLADPDVSGSGASNGRVELFNSVDNVLRYSFVKPTSASWISSGGGGGTSTEGVPTVQWEAAFSKDPGSDYWKWTVTGLNTDATDYIYLYDFMPTLTSTGTYIGVRSFAASSSSSTQYGLFIPDETKTYYVINYLAGGSATNLNEVVLASKNFAVNKVFCNFW